ncbi:hypothetical protein N9L68_05150 [bacterium]|nr:hypothetical protein [bacterium]
MHGLKRYVAAPRGASLIQDVSAHSVRAVVRRGGGNVLLFPPGIEEIQLEVREAPRPPLANRPTHVTSYTGICPGQLQDVLEQPPVDGIPPPRSQHVTVVIGPRRG